jgi:hypothetical protein
MTVRALLNSVQARCFRDRKRRRASNAVLAIAAPCLVAPYIWYVRVIPRPLAVLSDHKGPLSRWSAVQHYRL